MNPPPPAEGFASRLFLGPALRAQPDRRLVTLVREGYETAFEEIVRRYGKALGRYAAAIVGGRSEEVTQDAFSKALLALRREGDAEIELRPWLYRIVRNTALNDLRDRPPETAQLAEALEGAGSRSAAEEAERREEVSDLLERLRALPDPQRAAIVMRELEGLGHDEIAAALGMSGGAARQAIYRARQALRDGAGMMIPLPLVRVLIDHGAEAGVAAGAGGAVAAGGAIGGAGAGSALKVGAITAAVLAGGVGTGLALKDRPHHGEAETAAAAVRTAGGTTSSSASSRAGGLGASTSALGAGSSAGGGGGFRRARQRGRATGRRWRRRGRRRFRRPQLRPGRLGASPGRRRRPARGWRKRVVGRPSARLRPGWQLRARPRRRIRRTGRRRPQRPRVRGRRSGPIGGRRDARRRRLRRLSPPPPPPPGVEDATASSSPTGDGSGGGGGPGPN